MDCGNDNGFTRPRRGPSLRVWWGLCLLLLSSCSFRRGNLDEALLADNGAVQRNENVGDCYTVHCPDVLEVKVAGRPSLSSQCPIGPDGTIDLGSRDRVRVEGRTMPECARVIANEIGLSAARVRVTVAAYNSQHIYLFGQVSGLQRAVAYQGPETVLDLLQRTGGITKGASPNDIYVVRPRIAQKQAPEVFPIHLQAILVDKEQFTNLRLQPFDQVFIGQTRPSRLVKCIPPCIRPFYETFWGLRQNGKVSE
jgi:protein involved in polysaccharide export with SLBB domain